PAPFAILLLAAPSSHAPPPHSSAFFFQAAATTALYTLSLHDALPIYGVQSGTEPERVQRAYAGGPQQQRRGFGAQPVLAFQQGHPPPGLGQRPGGGQPSDARSHHYRGAAKSGCHVPLSIVVVGGADLGGARRRFRWPLPAR